MLGTGCPLALLSLSRHRQGTLALVGEEVLLSLWSESKAGSETTETCSERLLPVFLNEPSICYPILLCVT